MTQPAPFRPSRAISDTFGLISRKAGPLAIVSLLFFGIPDAVANFFMTTAGLDETAQFRIDNLISATVGLVGTVAVMELALSALDGRKTSVGGAVSKAASLFFPAFGLTWLVNAGTLIGLILLIVPGLILYTMWIVALPHRIATGPGVTAAISESVRLTKGRRWPVFGAMALCGLILLGMFVALFIAALVVGTIFGESEGTLISAVSVEPIFSMAVTTFGSVFAVAVYGQLRGGRRAETTAEVFA